MYDWINTGHQKVKKEQELVCRFCGGEEETLEHMFQCTHPWMEKVWEECWNVTQKTLRGIQFPTQVITLFMECLNGILNKSNINHQQQPCMEIVEAI